MKTSSVTRSKTQRNRDMSQEEVEHSFIDLPEDHFPLRILMFSPMGEVIFDETVTGPGALPIPGYGPGSVRYSLMLYGDGTVLFKDDPSCSGTVDIEVPPGELAAKMKQLIELNRKSGEYFKKSSNQILEGINWPEDKAFARRLRRFFTTQGHIGEQMIEAADKTERWLEEGEQAVQDSG